MSNIRLNNQPIITKIFPDGQPHVELEKNIFPSQVTNCFDISCRLKSSDDLMNLFLLTDILRARRKEKINVDIYYIHDRMDRRVGRGPLTLKVIANLINSQEYNSVRVFAPHSGATLLALNNSSQMLDEESKLFKFALDKMRGEYENDFSIVLPDTTAAKRFYELYIENLREYYIPNGVNVISANKHRDVLTGKLSGFSIDESNISENCLMLDDLCDGGGTFIGLREKMTKVKNCHLAVHHGLFTKGLQTLFDGGIKEIYTTNSYKEQDKHPNMRILNMY